MLRETKHHIYPVIDIMLEKACDELAQDNIEISCKAGCAHCCYQLVEVTWDEGLVMLDWILAQPVDKQAEVVARLRKNAAVAKTLFSKDKRSARMLKPIKGDQIVPDSVYDNYFHELQEPCPFLQLDDNRCMAYAARPTACRTHLVSSPSEICAPNFALDDDDDIEIPEAIEDLKEDVGDILNSLQPDDRWGHMSTMLLRMLVEEGAISEEEASIEGVLPEQVKSAADAETHVA